MEFWAFKGRCGQGMEPSNPQICNKPESWNKWPWNKHSYQRPKKSRQMHVQDFTFCTSQALADALQHDKSLTYLDLEGNQIGDKGVEAPGLAILNFFQISHFAPRRLWPTPWSTTRPSPISTSMEIRLVIRGSRPGSCNSQFLSDFHILHLAGSRQCLAAQPEPHHSPPRWKWLWRCRSPGPVRRSVRRVVAPWRCSVRGTGANLWAPQGERRSCCKGWLDVDWEFAANSLLRFVFGFSLLLLLSFTIFQEILQRLQLLDADQSLRSILFVSLSSAFQVKSCWKYWWP